MTTAQRLAMIRRARARGSARERHAERFVRTIAPHLRGDDTPHALDPDALATARREGAEAMRADVKRVIGLHRAVREGREEALRAEGVPQGDCAFLCLATAVVSLDRVMREVEALPLPGDATEHATTPAPVCPAPTEGT